MLNITHLAKLSISLLTVMLGVTAPSLDARGGGGAHFEGGGMGHYDGGAGRYGDGMRDSDFNRRYDNRWDNYDNYGGYGGYYGGGYAAPYTTPYYPNPSSQPGMGDDSDALYQSYIRSNKPY